MKSLFSVALCLLFALNGYGQTFKKARGAATEVSISKNGKVYAVGTSKQIFKFDFTSQTFKLHSAANRSAKQLAAHDQWTYVLTTSGKMHITYANNKQRIGAIGSGTLQDIYLGKNNDLWSVDSYGRVQNFSSNWQPYALAGQDNKKVCVNNKGQVFSLKKNKAIYVYKNGRATKLPGAATDMTYDHTRQKLYVVGTSKRLFVWNPSRNNWDLVKNTRSDIKTIAAHNGQLWATTTKNEVYTTANIKDNAPPKRTNYSGRYRITVKHLYSRTWDPGLTAGSADLFGTIGVRVYGEGNSGKVEVRALESKPQRIWSASRSYAQTMQQYNFSQGSKALPTNFFRRHEIDKIREYNIQGELANQDLSFNIQMHLKKRGLVDEQFPWASRTIKVSDLKLGKEYVIESKINELKRVAVVFKVDKY